MAKESNSRRRNRLAAFAVAALALANPVEAQHKSGLWVLGMFRSVAQMRVDPIMNPGKVASHVHSIIGASNIRTVLNTPAEQLRADCTTTELQADKSNYWLPSLYHITPDNKYEPVVNHNRVYYFLNGDNIQPFPEGMRIISGTANNRYQWDERVKGIVNKCDNREIGNFLPNGTNSPDGCGVVTFGISFPSCGWDNQSLDSWDHWSHLTWSVGYGGGEVFQTKHGWVCPPSHPIKYPHIFLDASFVLTDKQRSEWRKGAGQISFILSNGDTEGQSLHADFVNGWDTEVLKAGLKECGDPQIGDNLKACAPFVPHLNATKQHQCRYQGMLPDEELGYWGPLDQLPGCNPRWDKAHGDLKPTDCPWYTGDPDFIVPNVMYSELQTESGIPMITKLNPDGSIPPPTVGKEPYPSPWGVDGKWRFAKFMDFNSIMSANTSVAYNLVDLKSDTDIVAGMKDTSAFTDAGGTHTLPESAYQTDPGLYTDVTTTWFVGEQYGQKRPTDAVNPADGTTFVPTPSPTSAAGNNTYSTGPTGSVGPGNASSASANVPESSSVPPSAPAGGSSPSNNVTSTATGTTTSTAPSVPGGVLQAHPTGISSSASTASIFPSGPSGPASVPPNSPVTSSPPGPDSVTPRSVRPAGPSGPPSVASGSVAHPGAGGAARPSKPPKKCHRRSRHKRHGHGSM